VAGVPQENASEKTLKRREYLKKYYEQNKHLYAARSKKYTAANREKVRERNREWNKRNKDRTAQYNKRTRERHRDRMRLYGLISSPGAEQFLVAKRDGCVYCGSTNDLQIDHIFPQSRGGEHAIRNMQWLCIKCNRSKSDQTEEEFFAHIKLVLDKITRRS
jgi:5-methylcytosine-specific restriction endonuclease McrA